MGWEEGGKVLRDIVQRVEAMGQAQKGEGGSRQALPVPFVCWLCLGEAKPGTILPLLLCGRSRLYALAPTLVALLSRQSVSFGDLSTAVCH